MRSVQVGKHPEEVAPEESASARDEDGLACEAMDEIAEIRHDFGGVLRVHIRSGHCHRPFCCRMRHVSIATFARCDEEVLGNSTYTNSPWMRDFQAAFLNEVRRNYHVTPSVADRPLMMDKYPLLRVVNMFYSYLMAAGPQRLRGWAQMPASMEARAWAASIASGWIYNTVMNELTQRQSISESADELIRRPHVALYKAVMQSGVVGALSRPIGWMDSLGIGPGTAMDVNYTPGGAASVQRCVSHDPMRFRGDA